MTQLQSADIERHGRNEQGRKGRYGWVLPNSGHHILSWERYIERVNCIVHGGNESRMTVG